MIAIKNNKMPVPVRGLVSEIIVSETKVGWFLYRRYKTGLRKHPGQNDWDVFVPVIDNNTLRPMWAHGTIGVPINSAIIMGSRDGDPYYFWIETEVAKECPLPNGFSLPAVWEPVEFYLAPSYPTGSSQAAEMLREFRFTDSGYRNIEPDPEEVFLREYVSYHAQLYSAWYREFVARHPEIHLESLVAGIETGYNRYLDAGDGRPLEAYLP